MNPEPIDFKTPVDYLEPEISENSYREASLSYLRIMSLATSYILAADDPQTATWGVTYALGLISVTGNKTMRELGRELGVSHGTISAHAQKFSRMCGLPPSVLMKTDAASQGCRKARNNFCTK